MEKQDVYRQINGDFIKIDINFVKQIYDLTG